LDGSRSGLWFEFQRIIFEVKPRFVVIENVPGLLSSNGGGDFQILLAGLIGAMPKVTKEGWRNAGIAKGREYNVAWRVLDSRYFGVAQRRRRVFVVASLNSGCCAEILFESEGGTGNTETSTEARPRLATDIAACLRGSGEGHRGHQLDAEQGLVTIAAPLTAGTAVSGNAPGRRQEDDVNLVVNPSYALRTNFLDRNGSLHSEEVAFTLDTQAPQAVTDQTVVSPLTTDPYADNAAEEGKLIIACNNFGERTGDSALTSNNQRIDGDTETFIVHENKSSHLKEDDHARALRAGASHSYQMVVGGFSAGQSAEAGSIGYEEEKSPTLKGASSGTNQVPAVVHAFDARQNAVLQYGDRTSALDQNGHTHGILNTIGVRRLTPIECERLQSFPDGWTSGFSDNVRYRMLGNAVTVNVLVWIFKRMVRYV
jgi:DNA (cytosine-5)-methyltransferase 1